MDFMKWLNSLDELLYEVMSWLVFFPKTLWRTIRHPSAMMRYADAQLDLPQESQYADALSPPLFLALALIIAHGVSIALGEADTIVANSHHLGAIIRDETSALLLRIIIFAAFPLVMSVQALRLGRQVVDRNTLRLPFYAQCYPTATFALGLSIGVSLSHAGVQMIRIIGAALPLAALLQYLFIETRWFASRLGAGLFKAFLLSVLATTQGFLLLIMAGFLFAR